jgi:hypothetical protein
LSLIRSENERSVGNCHPIILRTNKADNWAKEDGMKLKIRVFRNWKRATAVLLLAGTLSAALPTRAWAYRRHHHHNHHTGAKIIAGSAVGGAVIGGVAGGPKGALIGAGVGAGTGVAINHFRKRHHRRHYNR